ncbi:Na+/H+ antiporter NhaP [Gracilibacillus boraciitolerans JCM 21714]|uniref:Na+/H+ antiporter NhaP n=1 Tax=Gracilibacillus boraciitolerans JCM 21714 TaxID=1298598 RepID=W4VLL3_9BACI|nr:Na+/H+ antiporter NhaP [Gracilibacillus boraciitolerans JCM 21714]
MDLFLIAEAIHVSGVLATVASGMMISYEYGRAIKEDHFRRSLDGFWDIVEISFLAILFLVIGIEITEYISLEYFLYAFAIFILMVFVRILIVYMTTKIIHPLSWPYHFLISWAGLKGSMSVFLILTLYTKSTNGFNSEWVVAVTFTTVLISLVIQSLSIAPISRKILK